MIIVIYSALYLVLNHYHYNIHYKYNHYIMGYTVYHPTYPGLPDDHNRWESKGFLQYKLVVSMFENGRPLCHPYPLVNVYITMENHHF